MEVADRAHVKAHGKGHAKTHSRSMRKLMQKPMKKLTEKLSGHGKAYGTGHGKLNAHSEVRESLWRGHVRSHCSGGPWLSHFARASGQDRRQATPGASEIPLSILLTLRQVILPF